MHFCCFLYTTPTKLVTSIQDIEEVPAPLVATLNIYEPSDTSKQLEGLVKARAGSTKKLVKLN